VIGGYRVLVYRKAGFSEHHLRDGAELTFGRASDCSVCLSDSGVSRHHASVRLVSGDLEFFDLGSRNGSFVDGVKLEGNIARRINPNSVVRIGSAVLVFEPTESPKSQQWCFDRVVFEETTETLLAAARAGGRRAGVIELRWQTPPPRSTTAEQAPPAELEPIFARIVGGQGLIGAFDSGRLLLFLSDTDPQHFGQCMALVRSLCDQHRLSVEVRGASSTDATTIYKLLTQATAERAVGLVPPVIFQGVLGSVEALLAKLHASDSPVLVVGETGVGKDVLARTIHARSRRQNKPFLALNCAAINEALFESELFGHERGAFTGAAQAKIGLLESAQGGSVFLDEVGEMPLGLQAKMLRVIESREVFRVGALVPKPIDVRFLFATNRDLHREIESRRFRSDLFFRIATITLTVPALRERVEEIIPLAEHFIESSARQLGRAAPRLTPQATSLLREHAWPGNVRELKNVIDLAVVVSDGPWLRPSDLHIERYVPVAAGLESSATKDDAAWPYRSGLIDKGTAGYTEKEKTERERILNALERSLWNQSAAAKLLGMPRRTLVKRLAQYGVPRPRKRDA
jgi:DNA-binding NtrC family response regulator